METFRKNHPIVFVIFLFTLSAGLVALGCYMGQMMAHLAWNGYMALNTWMRSVIVVGLLLVMISLHISLQNRKD